LTPLQFYGVYGEVVNTATTTPFPIIPSPAGVFGHSTTNVGVGVTGGPAVGVEAGLANTGAGTLFAATGLKVDSITNSGGGTVSTTYGIYVLTQTVGTNDYGVAIEAADTATLVVSANADNTTAAAGIMFGSSRDTKLYRSAASTLKTDGMLDVAQATVG